MDLRALGNRIRSLREKRRLKQSDVANALQISPQAVSKWERGENAPDLAVLLDLSKVLGVTTDWLLGRGEPDRDTFEATVFCTALNGFAERAARQPPREVAAYANGIFHVLTEAVLRHEGVPVKYVGDGFLAFFAGTGHAERALRAALDVQSQVAGRELVVMLHAGEVFLGAMGHSDYARADIMGETVNTAFLLLAWASQRVPERIALTESVAGKIGGVMALSAPRSAQVRGVPGKTKIYVPQMGDTSKGVRHVR
jgi:class 3 adenylate cyclase